MRLQGLVNATEQRNTRCSGADIEAIIGLFSAIPTSFLRVGMKWET